MYSNIHAELAPIYAVPEADAKLFIQWVYDQRKNTNFDMDTLSYPRSCMTTAKAGDETLMMIPLQPTLWFESMIKKPGLTDRQSAMCMYKIGDAVERAAKDTGHKEGYFLTNSAAEVDAVSKRGWTIVLHDAERGQWLMKKKLNPVHPDKAAAKCE